MEGGELSLEYVEVPMGVIIWGDGEVMDRDLDPQRKVEREDKGTNGRALERTDI